MQSRAQSKKKWLQFFFLDKIRYEMEVKKKKKKRKKPHNFAIVFPCRESGEPGESIHSSLSCHGPCHDAILFYIYYIFKKKGAAANFQMVAKMKKKTRFIFPL